jgi:hypothetical protein
LTQLYKTYVLLVYYVISKMGSGTYSSLASYWLEFWVLVFAFLSFRKDLPDTADTLSSFLNPEPEIIWNGRPKGKDQILRAHPRDCDGPESC